MSEVTDQLGSPCPRRSMWETGGGW